MAVTLVRGLPGSGKSHYVKNNFGGALVIEGDQRFVEVDGSYRWDPNVNSREYTLAMLETALKNNLKHVLITNAAGHKRSIDAIAEVAKKYGHDLRVMWLDYLNGEGLNDRGVTSDILDRMKHQWQLYPGETYARRVADGYGSSFSKFGLKIVDTPPPWYTSTHRANKIIFLDVDGVLNPNFNVVPGKEFYTEPMRQLKELVLSTGAEIVLSSTWGYTKETRKRVADELMSYDLELYANIYQYNNCTFMKGDELKDKDVIIQNWLQYHPEVERYVVLDDWDYSKSFPDNFVHTFDPENRRYGLDDYFRFAAECILGKNVQ